MISCSSSDCIERARGYHDRGTRYNVMSPHAGGIPDAGNSLLAVKRLVYEEGRLGYAELATALCANWEGT